MCYRFSTIFSRQISRWCLFLGLGVSVGVGASLFNNRVYGQSPVTAAQDSAGSSQLRVADRVVPQTNPVVEHPLMPAIRWAYQGLQDLQKIQDYSAIMVKRERVKGKLNDPEYTFVKIRHKPFSVYMLFLEPASVKGQEVIYVEGQNDGKMWAHPAGLKNKLIGTVSLDPTGPIAMQNNRYPITEIGVLNLVRRLIEVGEQEVKYGECEVKFFEGAKINDRTCTCIQVVHPVPRRNFRFHLARIYVDTEHNLPVRYESYDWPTEPDGAPQLIEEYTYLNIKVNNGFTDLDFDIRNPNYAFRVKDNSQAQQ
ncbi:MAG: DUF1571 domain-containing protein [Thermogutta sp.]